VNELHVFQSRFTSRIALQKKQVSDFSSPQGFTPALKNSTLPSPACFSRQNTPEQFIDNLLSRFAHGAVGERSTNSLLISRIARHECQPLAKASSRVHG